VHQVNCFCKPKLVASIVGLNYMRRRDFIKFVASPAIAWPLPANAQQSKPMRRIAMLFGISAEDAHAKARIAAFLQELNKLGWAEGGNVRIDLRAGEGNPITIREVRDRIGCA
jgi:hypothetical protein